MHIIYAIPDEFVYPTPDKILSCFLLYTWQIQTYISVMCLIFMSVYIIPSFFLQSSLLSDKFKRPFKKRHSSLPHAPSNRVNKYLAQAIEARSVDREKSTHVSLVTLCFRDREKERDVSGMKDGSYDAQRRREI